MLQAKNFYYKECKLSLMQVVSVTRSCNAQYRAKETGEGKTKDGRMTSKIGLVKTSTAVIKNPRTITRQKIVDNVGSSRHVLRFIISTTRARGNTASHQTTCHQTHRPLQSLSVTLPEIILVATSTAPRKVLVLISSNELSASHHSCFSRLNNGILVDTKFTYFRVDFLNTPDVSTCFYRF